MKDRWYYKTATLRISRWKAFWDLVVRGKYINFSVWTNHEDAEGYITLDAESITERINAETA